MTDTQGWFSGRDPADREAIVAGIRDGEADAPRDWPRLAVEAGFVGDEDAYYDKLHEATMAATREAVDERERADDRRIVHAVRAMDDCRRSANELAERLSEWGGAVDDDAGTGVAYARELVEREAAADGVGDDRLGSLAARVVDLADEADALRSFVEERTTALAPNLSALAGPILAARLLSLAGGLETLAKRPSGTVQVLGAEDALFAHLQGHASSPKHGIIYTHEYVRGTRPQDRGSAARALAGKLAIAARVDHYSGDYRPELEAELDERMATIRARAEDSGPDESGDENGGESGD